MKKQLIETVPLTHRQIFALNLRRYRRIKEISQETLALTAKMSRSYVSGVERGERNISIDNMGLLAEALGISLQDLLNPQLFDHLDKK